MSEYQPLSDPGDVQFKLGHWKEKPRIPNRTLFQLMQDVACSRGGTRWREHPEISMFTRNDSKVGIGYSALSARMRIYDGVGNISIVYDVRKVGRSFRLFKITDGTESEVPPSEVELRRKIVFVLSDVQANTPSMK